MKLKLLMLLTLITSAKILLGSRFMLGSISAGNPITFTPLALVSSNRIFQGLITNIMGLEELMKSEN